MPALFHCEAGGKPMRRASTPNGAAFLRLYGTFDPTQTGLAAERPISPRAPPAILGMPGAEMSPAAPQRGARSSSV